MRFTLPGAALIALTSVLTACGPDDSARTITVPGDAGTIQAAVDDARPGDTVLIAGGTYNEAVKVTTDGIVIRGEDRNKVVLDGEHRLANGVYVAADGVRVENLTVRSYTQNGVVFNGIDAASGGDGVDPGITYGTDNRALNGYEVRYVTTYNNGLYGIYAFASRERPDRALLRIRPPRLRHLHRPVQAVPHRDPRGHRGAQRDRLLRHQRLR